MFGYVNINKQELKVKDFQRYKSYYCGLCHNLKKNYSALGQITLSYDMTFLTILLTSLYESKNTTQKRNCVVHPIKKQEIFTTQVMDYVSDMNIALTYQHFMDDWMDDKSIVALTSIQLYKKYYMKIEKKYPRQCKAMEESLQILHKYEKKSSVHVDEVATVFGRLMEELFIMKEDIWSIHLRKMGFYLGKYIYILDAYDDIEEDIKKKRYNPLQLEYQKEDFDHIVNEYLTLMISEASQGFEQLPCIIDVDILRNIIYDGVWLKFNKIRIDRKEQKHNDK